MYPERLPPHDFDAEEAAIGSLLIDGEAIYKVVGLLSPEDFYREKNNWAYEACVSLYQRNEGINQVTVAHELARRERLEAMGGAAYLSYLVSVVPTSVHIEHYAQIVHRCSMMRRLIAAADQIREIGYEGTADVDRALGRAEEVLFRLRHGESPRDFVHIRRILDKYFEEEPSPAAGERGEIAHVLTGFPVLDELLGGLQRSDMVVLGARPSMGKTSLALCIGRNAAVEQRAHVAIFSLEMSKEQLVHRLIAAESGVDAKRVRLGLQNEAEERQIIDATGVLSEAPIYIDDSPMLSVVQMRSKARRLHNERRIDLIVVDFLQLVRGSGAYQNPVQEMSDISRSLKALARDLNVPVLAASQLSRAVEQRTPKVPILSDLRESGSIEQDADVVMFIYREDMYTSEEDWERRTPGEPNPKGVADIIVAKHRNGPTGKRELFFRERTAKFVSLQPQLERQP